MPRAKAATRARATRTPV
ncbi:TPA_asm: UL9.5 iORF 1 [Human alphaherpesvirus 1]|nr:TPA_asm: UL9.5 iORF 1 [Human alphaherpesvirus 1]